MAITKQRLVSHWDGVLFWPVVLPVCIDLSAPRMGESTRKRGREREKQVKPNASVTASHSSSGPLRKWLLREAGNDNTLVFRKPRKDPS